MFEMNVPYDKGTMKIRLPEKNIAGVLEGKQSEYTTELYEKEMLKKIILWIIIDIIGEFM